MAERLMGRRQSLKYLGMLAGTVAGREFLAAWLPKSAAAKEPGHDAHLRPTANPPTERPYTPLFFEKDEWSAVEVLTELIIPTDESPGAREAQVARYIDFIVSAAAEFNPSLQQQWAEGLQLLDRLSREKYQSAFHEISTRDKEKLLEEMSLPERDAGQTHPGYDFYRLVKDMTVEGFYTSRVGLIDVLGYQGLRALGEFPGCTHPEHQT
jgi:gluconate 2-dehydrogenase gamma chain